MSPFVRNPLFEQEFKRELRTRAAMLELAAKLKALVELVAPHGQSGYYHRSIVAGEDALSAYVATKDFAGHIVEWGSINNPAYAPIRRAVLEAGFALHELGRP